MFSSSPIKATDHQIPRPSFPRPRSLNLDLPHTFVSKRLHSSDSEASAKRPSRSPAVKLKHTRSLIFSESPTQPPPSPGSSANGGSGISATYLVQGEESNDEELPVFSLDGPFNVEAFTKSFEWHVRRWEQHPDEGRALDLNLFGHDFSKPAKKTKPMTESEMAQLMEQVEAVTDSDSDDDVDEENCGTSRDAVDRGLQIGQN